MSISIVLTLFIFGVGVAIMVWLQPIFAGLTAALIGFLFFPFSLALWKSPESKFQRGNRVAPTQRGIVGAFLGVGLSVFGGLAAVKPVPRPFDCPGSGGDDPRQLVLREMRIIVLALLTVDALFD